MCKVLHFERNNQQWQYSMLSNLSERQPISKSTSDRDLGVVADEHLKFNCHTHITVAGANQTPGIIKHKITSGSPAIVTKLYKPGET